MKVFVQVLFIMTSGQPHQPIQAVSRRTGLSNHVIRVWEKRYAAVEPTRTASNRRLYSEEQIERLLLLRRLTESGQGIRYIAALPTSELRELAGAASPPAAPAGKSQGRPQVAIAGLLATCIDAVKTLNAGSLGSALEQAESTLGIQGMLQKIAAPLAQSLGSLWREGELTAAHEHFATAVLRTYLGKTTPLFASAGNEPVLVVATPARQLHEIGALLAAAMAANIGWRVTYLGAGLPAPEIAGAVRQSQSAALALSIVYPEDDAKIDGELTRLRELLPADFPVIVGGRAVPAYHSVIERIGALQARDLSHLCELLDEVRSSAGKRHAAATPKTDSSS
jgi:DNA-binding transcriptional MerR regulator/methylmalonyl-CoA mutase cobalamin-binding subunit